MEKTQLSRPLKGQLRCNQCKKTCPAKNGDWFHPAENPSQQIFLCKECESAAKGAFKKANGNIRH